MTPASPSIQPTATPAEGVPQAPARTDADRVAQLFRIATPTGRVHPLQHLIQRYRAGERA